MSKLDQLLHLDVGQGTVLLTFAREIPFDLRTPANHYTLKRSFKDASFLDARWPNRRLLSVLSAG
jgi:hypothetical protein